MRVSFEDPKTGTARIEACAQGRTNVRTISSALALMPVLVFAISSAGCGSGNHLVSIAVTPNPANISSPGSVRLQAIGKMIVTWTAGPPPREHEARPNPWTGWSNQALPRKEFRKEDYRSIAYAASALRAEGSRRLRDRTRNLLTPLPNSLRERLWTNLLL